MTHGAVLAPLVNKAVDGFHSITILIIVVGTIMVAVTLAFRKIEARLTAKRGRRREAIK